MNRFLGSLSHKGAQNFLHAASLKHRHDIKHGVDYSKMKRKNIDDRETCGSERNSENHREPEITLTQPSVLTAKCMTFEQFDGGNIIYLSLRFFMVLLSFIISLTEFILSQKIV